MSQLLRVWPMMIEDPLGVEDLRSRQPSTVTALRNNPDLVGLEVMIWRQDDTAIISNRIRWIESHNGAFRYRNVAEYEAADIRAVMDLTQGSTASGLQDVMRSLPAKSVDGKNAAGWSSCMLTRHGVLLASPGARKVGRDEVWRDACRKEAEIPAQDLREMVENGLRLTFGSQVATLVTGERENLSNHEMLVEHNAIRCLLEQHVNRVCELIPEDRRIRLHPEWTPLSSL